MSVSLACFGFHWIESDRESGSMPDVFYTHGVLMDLDELQFFHYLEQRLGAIFSSKKPILRHEQWSNLFEMMPNSWSEFELQSLKLIEQKLLSLYLEAEALSAFEMNNESVIDDSWIDDKIGERHPVSPLSKKKQQRRSPKYGTGKNKVGKSDLATDSCQSLDSKKNHVTNSLPTCSEDVGLEDCDFASWSTVTRRKQLKKCVSDEVSPVASALSASTSTAVSSNTSDSMSEICSTDNAINFDTPSAIGEEGNVSLERGWWIAEDIGKSTLEWYFHCPQYDLDKTEGIDCAAAATRYRAVTKRTFVEYELPPCTSGSARVRSRSANM